MSNCSRSSAARTPPWPLRVLFSSATSQAAMDRSRLSAAVYKRTGIVIDPGDPAFAVVEPNRLVIEEVASRVAERLETLSERIQSSAKALATEVAHQGVQRVVETLREARQTIASD